MKDDFLDDNFYEFLLLGPLFKVYSAIDKKQKINFEKYAYLLIDKFSIHSSSFIHLSKGIIERKTSGEILSAKGYDLFTVNSTFRAILETYITFYHIYIAPKSEDEKRFKILLWKIDGLNERLKCSIDESSLEIKKLIIENKNNLNKLEDEIKTSSFYQNNLPEELIKIFNPEKKKYCWRFDFKSQKIKPMTIIRLIEETLKTSGFINAYRHCSTHTHSSYLSIEEFEKFRGKPIPESYALPLIKLAIFVTCMIIDDITQIDNNARIEFEKLDESVKCFIKGMSQSIRNASS